MRSFASSWPIAIWIIFMERSWKWVCPNLYEGFHSVMDVWWLCYVVLMLYSWSLPDAEAELGASSNDTVRALHQSRTLTASSIFLWISAFGFALCILCILFGWIVSCYVLFVSVCVWIRGTWEHPRIAQKEARSRVGKHNLTSDDGEVFQQCWSFEHESSFLLRLIRHERFWCWE